MKGRIAAWVVVLGIGWLGFHFVSKWKNPWQGVGSVTAVMPAMPGCGKDCTK